MSTPLGFWVAFNLFVLGMLLLDLVVIRRKAHVVAVGEALGWVGVWVSLALLFGIGVYFWRGTETALEFYAGYLIEESLSVDNIFVFLMLFSYFRVPPEYQHKVLFWGIIGALVMRACFIAAGIALIHLFHPVIYVFGIFLIVMGVTMAMQKDKEVHPDKNPALRLVRRLLPMTPEYVDGKFIVKRDGRWLATPLFVVLIAVESTDLIFAFDSIPAVLAITTDPFIVYTSNVFAILGLRALFFAVAGLLRLFHYLHYGVSVILVFVGVKMVLGDVYTIPTAIALGVIVTLLAVSVIASLLHPRRDEPIPAFSQRRDKEKAPH